MQDTVSFHLLFGGKAPPGHEVKNLQRKTWEKEVTMFIKSDPFRYAKQRTPASLKSHWQSNIITVRTGVMKAQVEQEKSQRLQLITDGAAWEARNTMRKKKKKSLEQHWWDSEDLRLVWDLRIPSVQCMAARVALNWESSFGWKRKARHQLLNTGWPVDDVSCTRRAHNAFYHNDTTCGSAPYFWLQSEVAMHCGLMQKHESTPGGSETVQIFTSFKTVFPLLNICLADKSNYKNTSSVSALVSSRTR